MTERVHPDAANPLDQDWWKKAQQEHFIAPDDVPILAPCEKVRPGFEALVCTATIIFPV